MWDWAKHTNTGRQPTVVVRCILSSGSALLLTVTALGWGNLELTPGVAYFLLVLAFAVMAVLVVWKWSLSRQYGRLDPFELPIWFTINVFLFMVLSGAVAFSDGGYLYARLNGDYWYLVLALFYVSTGTFALWLGYRFTLGTLNREPRASLAAGTISNVTIIQPVAVLCLYAVSVGIRLFQIATGQYAYLQDTGASDFLAIRQWLTYGAQIWVIVLPATALTALRRRVPLLSLTTLLFMVLIEAAFTFLGGTKGAIIQLLALIVACSFYARHRIPWRLVVASGLLFILVFPINQLYRPAVLSGAVDNRNLFAAAGTIATLAEETWLSAPLMENLQAFLDGVIGRQSMLIQSVSLAAYVTPDTIPYRYGHDYFLLPLYILIPRIIWPSKPMLSGSVQFSIDYVGERPNTINSTAVTPFGDFYLNFGLAGILVGMYLLGIVYRWCYQMVCESNAEPSLVLYLGLLFWAANIEGEVVGLIQGFIQQLIIFYVLTRVMYRRRVRPKSKSVNSDDRAHRMQEPEVVWPN